MKKKTHTSHLEYQLPLDNSSFQEGTSKSNLTSFYSSTDNLKSLEQLENPANVINKLKEIDWSFENDNTTYLSHDIHPYPAKFIPQIPRNFIVHLSLRGELVWDPFGGSGTTALEAILLGRRALSSDVNPLSEIIGKGKTLTLIKEEEDCINDFIERLTILAADPLNVQEVISQHRTIFSAYIPEIPNINLWFHQNAVEELAYLRWYIEQMEFPRARALAYVSFSKSILRASYQDEETRYSSRPREIPHGQVISIFAANLTLALKRARELAPLLRFREADFRTLDLRESVVNNTLAKCIAPNSVDLVVTSPPYANSNDYHLYHRFRIFWLGHDPREFGKREIGSHLRHQREDSAFESYLDEMRCALQNIEKALRPGRFAVLVLGGSIFKGVAYDTTEHLRRLAQDVGLEWVETIKRTVHKTKRSFVVAGRRANDEDLLILRKPVRSGEITLLSPSYRLWPYEVDLRKEEIKTLLEREPRPGDENSLKVNLSSLTIDKLRRLTFTHGFASSFIAQESTWQAVLENGDVKTNSRRKDPKYATHGIHEYKGKFYPQLAKCLFNIARLAPGQKVIDPFCGSGTVLLESYLNGLTGFGIDMNPLAIKISRAKLGVLEVDPYLRDRQLAKLQEKLDQMDDSIRWISVFPEALHKEIYAWFPKPVIGKLGWLLNEISHVPDVRVREFLEVLVSSIIRDVSQQDPRDLRIRRRATPIENASVKELFTNRLVEQRKRLQLFSERSNRSPFVFKPAHPILGDSRNLETYPNNEISEKFDAVITSPPYATALPYIDTDRLSILVILGIDSSKRGVLEENITGSREIKKKAKTDYNNKIDENDWGSINSVTASRIISEIKGKNQNSNGGFRKQNMAALLYRYFSDMTKVFGNLDKVLKPGAPAFFVIGDTKTVAGDDTVLIKSGQVLKEIGEALGWTVKNVIPITVTTEDRAHSKNSITDNDIIWFEKT
jgi:DNA modification methylase